MLFFTCIKLVACVLACAHVIVNIKWKTGLIPVILMNNENADHWLKHFGSKHRLHIVER